MALSDMIFKHHYKTEAKTVSLFKPFQVIVSSFVTLFRFKMNNNKQLVSCSNHNLDCKDLGIYIISPTLSN